MPRDPVHIREVLRSVFEELRRNSPPPREVERKLIARRLLELYPVEKPTEEKPAAEAKP